jgi:putative transposase
MSVASFSASQRAEHCVPHALSCPALGVSESWFYKWHDRAPTPRQLRRATLDEAVRESFEASGATYGSPRGHDGLAEAGWAVSEKTVAVSMRCRGLVGRPNAATAA